MQSVSLFTSKMHPDSGIAQIASKMLQQQSIPDGNIVLEWDQDQLNFVMLYLQVEEHITLPKTLLKAVFVDYLASYGRLKIDESKIIQNSTCAALYCWYWKDAFIVEIKS